MRKSTIAFLLLASILSASPSRAALLFSQQFDFPELEFTSSGNVANTADDFVATADWLVDSVEVKGGWYLNTEALGTDDSARPFQVEFYADQDGSPATIPIAQFNVTAPLVHLYGATTPFYGLYDTNVALPAAVRLAAGHTYWFTIYDTGIGSDTSFFFLAESYDGDGKTAARTATHPWYVYYDGDVDVNLFGSVVPEPTTLGMLAFIAVGLIARRRRK